MCHCVCRQFGSDCCEEVNGRENAEGRVRLEMTVTLERDLDEAETSQMIQDLGTIAAVLHFPPECLCIDTANKFSADIAKVGCVNLWAMRICGKNLISSTERQSRAV